MSETNKINFVHLHNHSEYSVLDGACRIDELLDKAIELGMPAVAITDHGNMYGAVEFYQKAKKKGIKPIIGCELYIAPESRFEKKAERGVKEASYHITLLAKNLTGYKNLLKLVSTAHLDGFYYKPRIDKEILKQHSEGIICLSGCLKGEPSYAVINNKPAEEIKKIVLEFKEIFQDDYYLEIHDHRLPEEKRVKDYFKNLSQELKIPLIAANDCHYIEKEDARIHDVLLCIQTGNILTDEKRLKFSTDEFYFKSQEEMAESFKDVPQAIENSLKIAEKCNLELSFDGMLLPNYPMEEEGKTREEFFRELCYQGLKERYNPVTEEIEDRLNFEMDMIKKMGFISYFLIVWDFINYARKNNIPVGPGRGSAAGSVVSYCLGITNVEPFKYALFFERFLNPDRISMPDIDIDFCYDRRGEVIDYVYKKYSTANVAQIITFGRMGAKGVIRDVARVLDFPYSEADKIAKLIPDEPNISLKKAIEIEPALKKLYKDNQELKEIIDIAFKLEGMVRNLSTHAAGVVISETPLTENVPLCRGSNGEVVTQYEMKCLEKIGLLKMDFLGLKTLTVIHNAVNIINRTKKQKIDLDKIPLDDQNAYQLLKKGKSIGVFQLESGGMQDLLKKSEPSRFTEIIDLIALYRPGPMNMLDDYVARKLGKAQISFDHPLLEPILKTTFGIMIYQEQVMQCANSLARFSLSQADSLRRIMGKKIASQMIHQRSLFVDGAVANNIPKNKAEQIFDTMARFAEYGFNKSHSTAYAVVSYQTAYLKANYPVEFMAALLSSELNNHDKITKYINECNDMGIKILPPDINESFSDFTVVEKNIRFGLAAIKNVGHTAVENIIKQRREEGSFTSIYDFIERIDPRVVNKKVLEALTKCGAFDSFGFHRSQLFEAVDTLINEGNRLKKEKESNQISLFSMLNEEENKQIKKDIIPAQDKEKWSKAEQLLYEKELLGFYITGHPLGEYQPLINSYSLTPIASMFEAQEEKEVKMGGVIVTVKITVTKKNNEKMAILKIEDETDNIEVILFPRSYRRCSEQIQKDIPVFVKGKLDIKEGTPKIIASDIRPLPEIENEPPTEIRIKIAEESFNQEKLLALKDTIQSSKGDCPVILNLETLKGNIVNILIGKVDPKKYVILKIKEHTGKAPISFTID